jgi:hypothetical protein
MATYNQNTHVNIIMALLKITAELLVRNTDGIKVINPIEIKISRSLSNPCDSSSLKANHINKATINPIAITKPICILVSSCMVIQPFSIVEL